jgi:hypothetical protein
VIAGLYLLLLTALGVLARVMRLRLLTRVLDAMTLPAFRRVLAAAAGASLVASSTLSFSPASAAGNDPAGPPVMVAIPDAAPGPAPEIPPTAPRPEATAPDPVPVEHPTPSSTAVAVVDPGDSLWSLAAGALERAWGRPPTNVEVVPYWQAVIRRNAGRLARAGNANLIFPGQQMELPTPPPAPP